MELTKEQVLAYLKENQEVIAEVVNSTHIENYLNTENGKKLLQPKLDKYFNKGLESWKENNLSKLVDDRVAELYPQETPEMRKIKELEAKLNQKEQEAIQKELMLKAQSIASEKGIPSHLAHYFVGQDEETTIANIDKFTNEYKSALDSAVIERTKGSTPKTQPTPKAQEVDVKRMSFTDFAKAYNQAQNTQ